MRTLIRNATVMLPGSDGERTDVCVEDGVIRDVAATNAVGGEDEVIDAAGLHLLPGVIDDQVHFRDPGHPHKEDFSTGSHAAARGGVTSVLDMPNTNPTTTTLDRLRAKIADVSTKSLVNFGFYVGATPDNLADLREVEAANLAAGIKIFIGSSTGDLLVDEQAALENIFANTTLPICAHCEDEQIVRANFQRIERENGGDWRVHDHSRVRDENAAVVSTTRACDLARRHGHRFHVLHVSTAAELAIFADHQGLLTAEVCPHHLLLSVDDYDRLGTLAQMNPSVKTTADAAQLWDALADGAVQVLATDHAPHTLADKDTSYPDSPSGVPAVENSLRLMLDGVADGKLSLRRLVEVMCDAPARVWDLVGKGRVAEGYDADLVLVDLERRHTIRNAEQATRAGWSPWDGTTTRGEVVRTVVAGRTVYLDGDFDTSARGRPLTYDHDRGGYWATGGGT